MEDINSDNLDEYIGENFIEQNKSKALAHLQGQNLDKETPMNIMMEKLGLDPK